MKVLYIWDADYPWDIRVEKICQALASQGLEMHIAARNLKKKPVREVSNVATIHRLPVWRSDRLNYFLSFPLFCSPIWARFLDRVIEQEGINLLIVRDLPMAIAAIWAGRRANCPVIFDMAEDYVAMIRDIWRESKFKGLNLLVRNPYLAKYIADYTFKRVDHTIIVVDEALDAVCKSGGDIKDVTIVSNTPRLAQFDLKKNSDELPCFNEIRADDAVIYTGGLQMPRGLQLVISAIPELLKEIPDFQFVVIGAGYGERTLKKMAKDLGVENHVLWVGWVNHEDLFHYIKKCKAGIIPHFSSEHVDTTIPNKVFDYMGCGIPVIASDARPLKRLMSETQAGLTFKSGDVVDLASTVLKVFRSNEPFGSNGKLAVQKQYNWKKDEERLKSVIDRFR